MNRRQMLMLSASLAVAPSLLLASVGVVLTAALTAVAAHYLLDLEPMRAMLLGTVLASTDAGEEAVMIGRGAYGRPWLLAQAPLTVEQVYLNGLGEFAYRNGLAR